MNPTRLLTPSLLIGLALALVGCEQDADDMAPPDGQLTLLDHKGALQCSDLESITVTTTLAAECQPATIDSVTVTAVSEPIRASMEQIYDALTDPQQFGALPRPLPPDFEPPPVPHSVAVPSAGEPFIEHYRLFYGALQTSTVRETHTDDAIEIVQLWRVNPAWTEADLALVYPDLPQAEIDAMLDTPIMDPGLRTIVTFTITRVNNPLADYGYVTMVQHGLPERSFPLVKQHWSQLYLDPLREYLEAP